MMDVSTPSGFLPDWKCELCLTKKNAALDYRNNESEEQLRVGFVPCRP